MDSMAPSYSSGLPVKNPNTPEVEVVTMDKKNKDLNGHHINIAEIWGIWRQHGIHEATPLCVDFELNTQKRGDAFEFVKSLNNYGFKSVELGLIDKSWNIKLTMLPQTWTLEKLAQQTATLQQSPPSHSTAARAVRIFSYA